MTLIYVSADPDPYRGAWFRFAGPLPDGFAQFAANGRLFDALTTSVRAENLKPALEFLRGRGRELFLDQWTEREDRK